MLASAASTSAPLLPPAPPPPPTVAALVGGSRQRCLCERACHAQRRRLIPPSFAAAVGDGLASPDLRPVALSGSARARDAPKHPGRTRRGLMEDHRALHSALGECARDALERPARERIRTAQRDERTRERPAASVRPSRYGTAGPPGSEEVAARTAPIRAQGPKARPKRVPPPRFR
jgi:hypothetical protein